MLAIAIGIGMSVLDGAVANIALPSMATQLEVSPAESVWIVNAYQLVVVTLLLPLAALGERIGFRRVYIAGLAVFTFGSLGCSLSHSFALLVAARVVQGMGAAGVMSVNGALVRHTYPQAELGRGVGLNALVVSLSAAVGPSLASLLLSLGSWEWLFAVNVPIGLVNLWLAARFLPSNPLTAERFDRLSAALSAVLFGGFFVGVDLFVHGGARRLALGCLLASLVAGALLLARGSTQPRPMIPLDLLKVPVFCLSVVASVCSFGAYMLAFVALPFYFESVLHYTQVQTGLMMTPWPVALGISAQAAGRWSDRISPALLGTAGLLLLAGGLSALAWLPAQPSFGDVAWRMALCGLGFGCFQAPNNRIMLSSAPPQRSGAAGGMLATARLLGMTGGTALAAIVFRLVPGRAEPVSLLVGAALAVMAAAASLLRRPRASRT